MNQADLTARYDLLQEQLLTLYENAPTDIESQIEHWRLTRLLNVTMYYARKEGYKHLGLQPLPTLQISEYNSKMAIKMMLLLQSLAKSPFGAENWSLADTSTEIVLTSPKNTFKKNGFQVEVMFDNDPDNIMTYTQWSDIYYQDISDMWHKASGEVDLNGLSFTDYTGEKRYFLLFYQDAEKYGTTGQWTVKFKNTTISSSVVTSSSKRAACNSEEAFCAEHYTRESSPEEGTSRGRQSSRDLEEVPSTTTASPPQTRGTRRRRRGGRGGGEQREGESTSRSSSPSAKRSRGGPSYPTPEEVESRHRSLPRHGLSRLRRLQEEARDPLLICLKGQANNLKCWRHRCNNKFSHLFSEVSSIFKWIGLEDDMGSSSRMLITFESNNQRQRFLQSVHLPKGTSYSFGSLDSL